MARPRKYVEAPPLTPLPYGILSAALVLDDLTGEAQLGVHYQPEACGVAHEHRGACFDAPDFGTLSVSVDTGGVATVTSAGQPAATTYTLSWGDGEADDTAATLNGETHTYAAPGAYTVTVTDNRHGYLAVAAVTVTAATATGPFDAVVSFSKVVDTGIDLVTADPFALYTLFQCAPVGVDLEDRATRALRAGEQRGLETALADRLPLAAGAVDLTPTPGTAVHPVDAIGILEGHAAANYGGVPTLHAPRRLGALVTAVGAVQRSGNGARLETVQGSSYASGGGYEGLAGPTGAPAAGAGEAWVYVTGQVVVRRAPTVDYTPMTMSRTPATNDALVLAERPYAVSWECVTAAVLVETGYAVPAIISGGGA